MSGAVPGHGPILVTGGAGFIGSNLVHRLASMGHDVIVLDALKRPGVEANLAWLTATHPRQVTAMIADIRDEATVTTAVSHAQAVFHLAGQVAVTTSMIDPATDFAVNLGGTFGLLEALRRQSRRVPLVFASTNKVYGNLHDVTLHCDDDRYMPEQTDLASHGIGETRALDFHTPYGCSKGGADQYVLDYARNFGIPACVLRMSCIYGERQMGTEDQGWVAHFMIQALRGRRINIYGDGRQVRDILQVGDAVDAYLGAWQHIETVSGKAFNLGGGPENAVSLRQVLDTIGEISGRHVDVVHDAWRPGDQRWYVSDTRAVRQALGLSAPLPWRQGLTGLADWLRQDAAVEAVS
jgi:CDP-paratose 2-epimerase